MISINRTMKRIFPLVMFLTIFTSLILCKPKKKEEIDPQLISFLLAQRTGAEGGCQKFILGESACVSVVDSALTACTSLIANVKSKITPQDKATDGVIELYFNCFVEANLIYNQAINCQKSSFNTSAEYRKAQRITSTSNSVNAVSAWKVQFNNCASLENGSPSASSGLRETGTKLTADPFQ